MRTSLQVLLVRLKRIVSVKFKLQGVGMTDDYDWDTYHLLYRDELKEGTKADSLRIGPGDYEYRDGQLRKVRAEMLHLHLNYRLLYETILQLQPKSVVELGCGGGNHCHNLKVLCRDLKVFGYDVSTGQLELFRELNPELNVADFQQMDLTLPAPKSYPEHDIAYTQAVIMHIHAGKGHLVALANAFRLATKQVVLMENWTRHDFMADIQTLHKAKVIGWPQLYFYYRPSPELANRPHIMVISSVPIPNYATLSDYSVLADADYINSEPAWKRLWRRVLRRRGRSLNDVIKQ
jgi:SAM-dependent methyltransferase